MAESKGLPTDLRKITYWYSVMQKQGLANKVTIFEYGYLSADEGVKKPIKEITQSAFNYLEKLCLCDESESRFMQLRSKNANKVIQVQNYVGVLLTPCGTQIEVLPKTVKSDLSSVAMENEARASLLMMLKTLKSFRHLITETAHLANNKMPLLEVFITQFLASVNSLIKQGLRSDYVTHEDNLHFFKGKLLVKQQLQKNFINKHQFYTEFDEYSTNRTENRLLHSALRKVLLYSQSIANQQLAQELCFAFEDVPCSKDILSDFESVNLSRGMQYYCTPLDWAKLILTGLSPQTMEGQSQATSLLFPMEALFESYVADYLSRRLASGYSLKSQSQSKTLVTHDNQGWFRLKPDLAFSKRDKLVCILDTKWKLLDQAKKNGSDKYGLSQSDFYQMFAYGHKYLGSKGTLVLIYPKQGDDRTGFTKVIEKPFKLDEHLKLYVVPFDLDKSAQNRIDLEFIFNQIEASCNRER